MAIFYSYFFFLIFLFCCCCFVFKPQERLYAFKLALMGIGVYSLMAVLSWLSYVNSGNAFVLYPDQYYFYEVADSLANEKSWKQIFIDCFVERIHYEHEAILFWFGSIGHFANMYADGNSVLLQLIHVALTASLIPLLVYKLLLYYFSVRTSWRNAVVYLFYSYVLHYCAFLLRDIHIALFCLILLVLIHGRFSIMRLVGQLIAVWILSEMRAESGLIAMPLVLLYVFLPRKEQGAKAWKLWSVRIAVIAFGVLLSSTMLERLDSVAQSMTNYTSYTADAVGAGSAALQKLYSLPWGINYLGIVALSQMSPFPFWGIFRNVQNIYQCITLIGLGVAPMYWFHVNGVLIRSWLSRCVHIRIPIMVKWLLLFFVAFLFLNVFNMTIRRLICFYPIAFLGYVFCKEQLSVGQRTKMLWQNCSLYVILCVLYLIVMS